MSSMSGGDKLQKALAAMGCNLKLQMNVGILAGATNDALEPVAPYAAANEFGTLHIPARPFMRITVAEKTGEWGAALGKLVKGKSLDGNGMTQAFNGLGPLMVQDIKNTIDHVVPPESADATVAAKIRKGLARPEQTLVDSGVMQKSVDFEIINGGD
ncbi:hypothetical protein [Rouxiella sp. WC2420]|uniref:Uncharacterized protein n=1 Tax=Rouxiella sp. WC2420 TaxID=3234145 RepID=A0AB39VJY9_9GAMM